MIRAVVLFGVLDDLHPTGAVQETSQKLSVKRSVLCQFSWKVALVFIGWQDFDGVCTEMNQSKGSERNSGTVSVSAILLHVRKREARMSIGGR